MRISIKAISGLAMLVMLSGCASKAGPEVASLILVNGNVYSFSWDDPDGEGRPAANAPVTARVWHADASAIAIARDRIIFVGSDVEAQQYVGSDTRVVDLAFATVVPGLIESHGHVQELGEHSEELDLTGAASPDEIVDLVATRAATAPAGAWILGWGWDEGAWANQLPDWDALNERVPNNPVVLKGRRGFGAWGNRLAFDNAGITEAAENPDGGAYVRRGGADAGPLTGVALNNAVDVLYAAIPELTLEQRERILRFGLNELARSGFVAAHHAGVKADYMPAYEALAAKGELPIRTYVMLAATPDNSELVDAWIERGPTRAIRDMLQVRGVKAYYDGSLGSRGARLLADYSDMVGHRGVSGAEYGFDELLVARAMAAGFQVGIHAIGDEGNRHALDFYERTFKSNPGTIGRHRIEHAQVIAPEDIPRFQQLDIVASMQPGHAIEDSPWVEDRLGRRRAQGAYAWRSLRRAGATVIFNSDYSGTDHSLFYGLYAAVSRQRTDGTPAGGWYPEQRVTVEEAMRAYTVWPARATGIERSTGSLAPGKWANITVLSRDPMNVNASNAADLLRGEVVMTIVDGRIVHDVRSLAEAGAWD